MIANETPHEGRHHCPTSFYWKLFGRSLAKELGPDGGKIAVGWKLRKKIPILAQESEEKVLSPDRVASCF